MEIQANNTCHIVVMPYPGRGHINPMMNLCNSLLLSSPSPQSIIITVVVTEEWLGFMGSKPNLDNIRFATIPNVIPSERVRAKDMDSFYEALMTKMEAPFENLLDRLELPPTLILTDLLLFWAVRVGRKRNIPVASFWPMSASLFSVFKHFNLLQQHGHLPVDLNEMCDVRADYIPGIHSTRLADFPHFIDGSSKQILKRMMESFDWVPKSSYLILTSIYELEPSVTDIIKSQYSMAVYSIGSVKPHQSTEKENSSSEVDYFKWLDSKPPNSVVYVSSGSFLSASSTQIDEIAAGLCESGVPFLWVVRVDQLDKLREFCGDKGLVVDWCDQMNVLTHSSIGGFWSHCGWSSSRESVSAGVPVLTFPLMLDQPINSNLIVDDWKIGWRVKKNIGFNVLVTRDEIVRLLRKFMDSGNDEVIGMRKRAKELQKVYQQAVGHGGSTDANIKEFLSEITKLTGIN